MTRMDLVLLHAALIMRLRVPRRHTTDQVWAFLETHSPFTQGRLP